MSNSAVAVPNPSSPELTVVPAPKPKRARGVFNKRQLAELNKAGLICQECLKPEYQPKIAAEGKNAAFVDALLGKIQSAGTCGTNAVAGTADRITATEEGGTARTKLLRRLRQVQSKAKLKHQFDNPAQLRAYLVGEAIGSSRAVLEQSAQTVLGKAAQEKPGGIDTDFLTQAEAERVAYVKSKTTQREKQALAKAERRARDQFVEAIQRGRIELQLAADAAWPAGVPENEAVRALFFLEPNRSYSA